MMKKLKILMQDQQVQQVQVLLPPLDLTMDQQHQRKQLQVILMLVLQLVPSQQPHRLPQKIHILDQPLLPKLEQLLLVTLIQVQTQIQHPFKLQIRMGDHLRQLVLTLKLLVARMVHPIQILNHWQVMATLNQLLANLLLLSQIKVIMDQQLEAQILQPLSHHTEAQVEHLSQLDLTLLLLKFSQATHMLHQQVSPKTKDPTFHPKAKEIH